MNREQRRLIKRLEFQVNSLDVWNMSGLTTINVVAGNVAGELKLLLAYELEKWENTPFNLKYMREKEYEEDVYQLEVAIAALDEVHKVSDVRRIVHLFDEAAEAMGNLAKDAD